jgi:hypothetical protein
MSINVGPQPFLDRQQQQLGEFAERPDIDLSPDEHDWLAASVYECGYVTYHPPKNSDTFFFTEIYLQGHSTRTLIQTRVQRSKSSFHIQILHCT